jgi:hypothetical protein
MTRSGYFAAIAGGLGPTGDSRRGVVLRPNRRPYGAEPAHAGGGLPPADPVAPAGNRPQPHGDASTTVLEPPGRAAERSARAADPSAPATLPRRDARVSELSAPEADFSVPRARASAWRSDGPATPAREEPPRQLSEDQPGEARGRSAADDRRPAAPALAPPPARDRLEPFAPFPVPRRERARRAAGETTTRLHIGTIDVTVVPAAPTPVAQPRAPLPRAARAAPAQAPLSKRAGPCFGFGQR